MERLQKALGRWLWLLLLLLLALAWQSEEALGQALALLVICGCIFKLLALTDPRRRQHPEEHEP